MKKKEQKTIAGDYVTLAHGNGGKLTHDLIESVFMTAFDNPILGERSDSALIRIPVHTLAFSTDAYVVQPLIFPGGNIGTLAVSGTVNDIAVTGARPQFLSASFIIEEGFPINTLKEITGSMATTALEAGIQIVTGDTKVVGKGQVDGLYITTSGIGSIDRGFATFSLDRVQHGDEIIVSGTIGDHGIAILAARQDFPITIPLESDCAPLNHLITTLITGVPRGAIRIMRDPTRGGIGTTLNEFVRDKSFGIQLTEESIPIRNEVRVICEMTGYDPLSIANEGKVLIISSRDASKKLIELLHNDPLGKDAAVIGTITEKNPGKVVMKTKIGGQRIIDMLTGDMFPRIC